MIRAVITVTNYDGIGPHGAKAFLEDRGRCLILDALKLRWPRASQRFRNAVAKWAKKHRMTAQIVTLGYPYSQGIRFAPNFPLKSTAQNAEIEGVHPLGGGMIAAQPVAASQPDELRPKNMGTVP